MLGVVNTFSEFILNSQLPFDSRALYYTSVIWASLRFGHPHSQNPSDMVIRCNPNPNSNRCTVI